MEDTQTGSYVCSKCGLCSDFNGFFYDRGVGERQTFQESSQTSLGTPTANLPRSLQDAANYAERRSGQVDPHLRRKAGIRLYLQGHDFNELFIEPAMSFLDELLTKKYLPIPRNDAVLANACVVVCMRRANAGAVLQRVCRPKAIVSQVAGFLKRMQRARVPDVRPCGLLKLVRSESVAQQLWPGKRREAERMASENLVRLRGRMPQRVAEISVAHIKVCPKLRKHPRENKSRSPLLDENCLGIQCHLCKKVV